MSFLSGVGKFIVGGVKTAVNAGASAVTGGSIKPFSDPWGKTGTTSTSTNTARWSEAQVTALVRDKAASPVGDFDGLGFQGLAKMTGWTTDEIAAVWGRIQSSPPGATSMANAAALAAAQQADSVVVRPLGIAAAQTGGSVFGSPVFLIGGALVVVVVLFLVMRK
jgi:hypothetical protein